MHPVPSPTFAAIVVAAGQGLRAGQSVPKQFAKWRGKSVVRHSVEALLAAGASGVFVAIPEGAEEIASAALAALPVRFVTGGATRQRSVALALEALAGQNPDRVLIHDAARPELPADVITRLLAALDDLAGAIPALPVVDSMVHADGNTMGDPADRDLLRRVQTPQAFRFADILAAHRGWQGEPTAGDDAQVLKAAGGAVALVEGDARLAKLT
ncbi:MAG: 2-C-methyl-D-erythritol 4-phosphate cytidylyltransferase, partial [Sphingomonadales bacterium]